MKKFILVTAFKLSTIAIALAQNVGVGNTNPQAGLDVEGSFALRIQTLTLVNGANNNVDISTAKAAFYNLSGPSADYSISGLDGGVNGRVITFYNNTTATLTVQNESANSTATNRLVLPNATDITIPASGSFTAQYHLSSNRWVVTGVSVAPPTNNGWSILGNAGTNAATNFIGTTDNQSLRFRTNNVQGMMLDSMGRVGIAVDTPRYALHVKDSFMLEKDSFQITYSSNILPAVAPFLGNLKFAGTTRELKAFSGNLLNGIYQNPDPSLGLGAIQGFIKPDLTDFNISILQNYPGQTMINVGTPFGAGQMSNINVWQQGLNINNGVNDAGGNTLNNSSIDMNEHQINSYVADNTLQKSIGVNHTDDSWNLYINDNSQTGVFSNFQAQIGQINSNISKGDTNSYMNRNYTQWNITNSSNVGSGKGAEVNANLERIRMNIWDNNVNRGSDVNLYDSMMNINNYSQTMKLALNEGNPHSNLHTNGSVANGAINWENSATLALDAKHHVILADANSGSMTITLPVSNTCRGREYIIKRTDGNLSNTVTIDGNGSSIDGNSTKVLTAQYEAVKLISDGGAWYILP